LESTLSLCVINLTPSDPSGTLPAFCRRRAPERSVVTVAAKLIKRPVTTIFHARRFNEFALEKFQGPFLFSLQRQFDWKTQFADGCLHFVNAREAAKIPALFAWQNEIRISFGARKTWQRFRAFAHGTDWFVLASRCLHWKKVSAERCSKNLYSKD
jgi:hypothetical protein